MWKKILAGFVGLIALVLIVASFQPAEFVVTRSQLVAAPPAQVFTQVDDFHNWAQWTPWLAADPAAQVVIEGSPSGVGAAYRWKGNGKIGEGAMTIVESQPPEKVRIKLEFIRPMPDIAEALFTFVVQGEGTEVTWQMQGHKNLIGKIMCLFMSMDKMVGSQFEIGLAKMKNIVEAKNVEPAK